MRKTMILICLVGCVLFVTANLFAWSWNENFYRNDDRFDTVSDHQNVPNQSFSRIVNLGTDCSTARAIIWGNEWPEHYHEVIDPVSGIPYRSTQDQLVDLFDHPAEMEVRGITDPNTTRRVNIYMIYPY